MHYLIAKEYKSFFKLYIDGEYYGPLYLADMRDLSITNECEIDDETLAEVHIKIYKRGLKKAIDLLVRAEHSRYDLRNKLKLKEYSDDMINLILDEAETMGFLNERRYAECYIRSNLGKKSINFIRHELENKNIASDIISEAMDITIEDTAFDEELAIRSIIDKKFSHLDMSDERSKNKVISYLLRHGYTISSFKNYLT